MTKKEPRKPSEAEEAAFYEQHQGEVSLWQPKPVAIRVRRGGPSTVFSLRLTPEELTELFAVAEARGVSTSEFIRRAALDVARSDKPGRERKVEDDLQIVKEAAERALAALHEAS